MGAYNDFVAAIREQLERESLSVRSAARRAGLPIRSVQGILEGHIPSVERAAEVAAALGLEFYIGPPREDELSATDSRLYRDLMSPDLGLVREIRETREYVLKHLEEILARLPAAPADTVPGETEVVRFPAWRQVDQIDLAVAAGSGAEVDDESVTEPLTFRLDWLKSHGLDPRQCTVLKVQGESMEPFLPEGSSILVDRARRRRRVGGVFVVRTADGVVVKRAGKDQAGAWQFLSDHPAWNPVPWPRDAEVIGEVKWMARTL